MFDELYSQLAQATFRGVGFLFVSSSRAGGRKTTTHEYPNTNRRYVEDLGKIVPTFTIEAIINGDENTYFQRRDKFIKALESPGPGQLSHPFYGNQNVAVLDYSNEESPNYLGKSTFRITFAVTGSAAAPQLDPGSGLALSAGVVAISQPINNSIANNLLAPITPLTNKISLYYLYSLYNSCIQQVRQSITKIGGLLAGTEAADDTKAQLSEIKNTAASYQATGYQDIQNSQTIADNLTNTFDSIDAIDTDPQNLYNTYQDMFGFGSNIAPPNSYTNVQRINITNYYTIVNNFNILSLAYAYSAATDLDYFTVNDIERIRQQLEAQYQYIISLEYLDRDVMDRLRDLRTKMREFFDDIGKDVYRILPIQTPMMPLAVLAYQYYGNLDNVDELEDLNNITDPSFVSGNVNIFVK